MQLTSRTEAGRFSQVSHLHLKGGLQLISVLNGLPTQEETNVRVAPAMAGASHVARLGSRVGGASRRAVSVELARA